MAPGGSGDRLYGARGVCETMARPRQIGLVVADRSRSLHRQHLGPGGVRLPAGNRGAEPLWRRSAGTMTRLTWLLRFVMAVLDTAISLRAARVDSRVKPANDEIAGVQESGA